MIDQPLPLEDTFGDILRKAIKRNRHERGTARRSLPESLSDTIAHWLKDDGAANDAQARAVAAILRLDGGKLADSAAGRW